MFGCRISSSSGEVAEFLCLGLLAVVSNKHKRSGWGISFREKKKVVRACFGSVYFRNDCRDVSYFFARYERNSPGVDVSS